VTELAFSNEGRELRPTDGLGFCVCCHPFFVADFWACLKPPEVDVNVAIALAESMFSYCHTSNTCKYWAQNA